MCPHEENGRCKKDPYHHVRSTRQPNLWGSTSRFVHPASISTPNVTFDPDLLDPCVCLLSIIPEGCRASGPSIPDHGFFIVSGFEKETENPREEHRFCMQK